MGLAAAVFAAVVVASAPAATPPEPGVLVIGDSVATGMYWYASATVEQHLDVHWEIAVCRRLAGASCVDQGVQPPTLLDVVASLGSVPPNVVVEMGYNDYPETFASYVDETMEALVAAGAQHVLWLTLREVRDPYPEMNGVLRAAAARYPQLALLDWNAFSGDHPEWFQGDGIHLDQTGGIAMGHFVHAALDARLRPLRATPPALPRLRPGVPYHALLHATGGNAAYLWSVVGGRLPLGLHLLRTGRLYGDPRTRAPLDAVVQVTDADGLAATEKIRAEPAPARPRSSG